MKEHRGSLYERMRFCSEFSVKGSLALGLNYDEDPRWHDRLNEVLYSTWYCKEFYPWIRGRFHEFV